MACYKTTKPTSSVTRALPILLLVNSLNTIESSSFPQSISSYTNTTLKIGTGGQLYSFADTATTEEYQAQTLESFVTKLLNNTKDMDADISQIINDNFWDIYERF